jgi:hypothetical protein
MRRIYRGSSVTVRLTRVKDGGRDFQRRAEILRSGRRRAVRQRQR